jgi:hypothetical protein
MIWKNSQWSSGILRELWEDAGNYCFDFFHEQSKLDEMLKSTHWYKSKNINDRLIEDLESIIQIDNVKILPYSYHRYYSDGEINYVYHAGAGTHTKLERLKTVIGGN